MKQTASRVVLIHALNDSSPLQLINSSQQQVIAELSTRGVLAHDVESSISQSSQPYNVELA